MNRPIVSQHSSEKLEDQPYIGSNPARAMVASPIYRLLFFLIINMVLAIAIKQNSLIATAHALGSVALGFYFLIKDDKPTRLIYVAAYIVGAEILWRGGNARVFWEFGKYALVALLTISMFKQKKFFSAAKLPAIFFVLLLPSIAILSNFDREGVSFNLSGPLLLAVSIMFFSTAEITLPQLKRILLMFLAPITGLAMLSNFTIITAETVDFVIGGRATSGGIGPNQVSSMLGLGIMAAFFYAILEKKSFFIRFLMILIAIWLIGQAALTLSRGGLWTGIGSVVVAAFFLLQDRRSRGLLFGGVILTILLGVFVVGPFLDSFSRGIVTNRVQDTDLTGRDKIMEADLYAFRENPIFGVGPGQSSKYHEITYRASTAHSEYTRLLAEHGSFGLISMLILLFLGIRYGLLISGRSPVTRSFAIACVAWTFLYMIHAAMRLSAPSFVFGLSAFTFLELNYTTLEEVS